MAKKHVIKKTAKRILVILLILFAMGAAGTNMYLSDFYHATERATQSLIDEAIDEISITVSAENRIAFEPLDIHDPFVAADSHEHKDGEEVSGLIFYPGGKVEAEAYAPLMRYCAEQGIVVVLCEMPFNLAFLSIDSANFAMDAHPEVDHWYIAGHSLGGVAASSFAASHLDKVEGLILLAAYSTEDLSKTDLRVLSLYGSNDGVLSMDAYEKNKPNLPASSVEIVILGGNHAGFGSYGAQDKDGQSDLAEGEQEKIAAKHMVDFIKAHK